MTELATVTYVIDWTNGVPLARFLQTFTSIYYQVGFRADRLRIVVVSQLTEPAELEFYDALAVSWLTSTDDAFNRGIDAADSDYIAFITAGDLVYRTDAVRLLFNTVRDNGARDLQMTYYKAERRYEDGVMRYTTGNGDDRHWGKWFRLAFLRAAGIRFDASLGAMRDRCFTTTALALASTAPERQPLWYNDNLPVYYKRADTDAEADRAADYYARSLDEFVRFRTKLLAQLTERKPELLLRDLSWTLRRCFEHSGELTADGRAKFAPVFAALLAAHRELISQSVSQLTADFRADEALGGLTEKNYLAFIGADK